MAFKASYKAVTVEQLINNWLTNLLSDHRALQQRLIASKPDLSTAELTTHLTKARELGGQIVDGKGVETLRAIIDNITISKEGLSIRYDENALLKQTGFKTSGRSHQHAGIKANLKKKGSEDKLVLAANYSKKDLPLIKMLVRAHGWVEMVRSGNARTIKDIARLNNLNEAYVHKHIKLALLAPDIQKAILEGTQPAALSLESLKTSGYDRCWDTQRKVLGF